MKTLNRCVIAIFMWIGFAGAVVAQNENLNREIRIAERILDELFSDVYEGDSFVMFNNQGRVNGEYIPGFGVHFIIGQNSFGGILRLSGSANAKESSGHSQQFVVGSGRNGEVISSEEIENRMMEYFTGYACQLRSLGENEVVRITFGNNRESNRFVVSLNGVASNREEHGQSSASMWVRGTDLKKYRDGALSESQFKSAVRRSNPGSESEMKDVSIFSSILQTAFTETDFPGLRVSRNVQSSYLSGWGAVFTVTASVRGNGFIHIMGANSTPPPPPSPNLAFSFDEGRFEIDTEAIKSFESRMEFHFDSLDKELTAKIDSLQLELPRMLDSLRVTIPQMVANVGSGFQTDSEIPSDEDLEEGKNRLYKEAEDIIRSYGTTLGSVEANELIAVQINWRGRNDILPRKTILYITKEDLSRNKSVEIIEE